MVLKWKWVVSVKGAELRGLGEEALLYVFFPLRKNSALWPPSKVTYLSKLRMLGSRVLVPKRRIETVFEGNFYLFTN